MHDDLAIRAEASGQSINALIVQAINGARWDALRDDEARVAASDGRINVDRGKYVALGSCEHVVVIGSNYVQLVGCMGVDITNSNGVQVDGVKIGDGS